MENYGIIEGLVNNLDKEIGVAHVPAQDTDIGQLQAQIAELENTLREYKIKDRQNERKIRQLGNALSSNELNTRMHSNQLSLRTIEQQRQEKYMDLLLANSPDIIIIMDTAGRIIYCTDVFLEFAHLKDHDEAYGKTLKDIFANIARQGKLDNVSTSLLQAAIDKKTIVVEDSLDFSGDGRERKYIAHITPLPGKNGEAEGFMLLLHDVDDIETAREEAEIAREDAENANFAKSNFLSNMSHEMRTPMNAIIGMTAIGRSAKDIGRKDYCLGKIDEASNHLLGVINDILDMSKIEAGKLELSDVKFDFEKVIRRVAGVIGYRIDQRAQIFDVHVDESIPHALIGDDQRLAQVVTNLLSNAVKFTPEGGRISLNARYEGEGNGNCKVRVDVTDTGIGIDEEQQRKLFSSFQQADSDTSRKFGGTGLGLAISKSIVEMMDGEIWIDSKPGEGSTFSFFVHLKQGAEGAPGMDDADIGFGIGYKAGSNAGAEAIEENAFAGKRILLAEDVEINKEIVLVLLEPTGVEIDCADNGAEAVRLFGANPDKYDLIFMDVQMPEMDGYKATEIIRAMDIKGAKDIPIIAMTANVFREDIEHCIISGMNDHVGKPLDFGEVLEKLHKYMD
jgi:PAS domain S-box-containing protein